MIFSNPILRLLISIIVPLHIILALIVDFVKQPHPCLNLSSYPRLDHPLDGVTNPKYK